MSKPEIYVPVKDHELKIADLSYTDPMTIECDDLELMYDTMREIEFAIGLRLETDLNRFGLPIMAANKPTWDLFDQLHSKTSTTRPKELFVEVTELTDMNVKTKVTLPLSNPGRKNKAVTGEFSYQPQDVKTGYHILRKLGRKALFGGVKLRENPFYVPSQTNEVVRGASFKSYLNSGNLGTC